MTIQRALGRETAVRWACSFWSRSTLRFDGWALDPESGDLEHGGARIRLQEQSTLVLKELISHAGRVVTRKHLIALLWPNGIVDFDTGLNTTIRKLRSALGDETDAPRYIETLPRRGYRFVGTLDAVPDAPTAGAVPGQGLTAPPSSAVPGRSPTRTVLVVGSVVGLSLVGFAADRLWFSKHQATATPAPAAIASAPVPATAAPIVPEKSVAVLPFVNISRDSENEYLSDGLSEELIDMLTKVPELRVPARTSSFYFKGKQATVADIAKALSVTHVLEGSVQKSGNKLRITAQLVRVDSGYHLWSQTYDRKLDDIFKIEDEISSTVVTALKASLLANETPPRAVARSAEAYALVLQGRYVYLRQAEGDNKAAADYFQQAIRFDPTSAAAWAGLSKALANLPGGWQVQRARAGRSGARSRPRSEARGSAHRHGQGTAVS